MLASVKYWYLSRMAGGIGVYSIDGSRRAALNTAAARLAHGEEVEQRLGPAVGVERPQAGQRLIVVVVVEAVVPRPVGGGRGGVDEPPLVVGAPAEEIAAEGEVGMDDLVGVRLGG